MRKFDRQPSTSVPLSLGEPLQVFQPLLLVHVGMQLQRGALQDGEKGGQPLDAVDAVGEDHGAARVLQQEVVEVEVLVVGGAVDSAFGQRLHGGLLPAQIDDLGLGLHAHLLHEALQLALLIHPLEVLLVQEAAGRLVDEGQRGREHKRLPLGVVVRLVEHLEQLAQLGVVTFLHHSVGFIDDETSVEGQRRG